MIRKTYGNMLKVTKMIADKGYEWNEANEIAMKCFDESKINGMSVEWWATRIVNKVNKLA